VNLSLKTKILASGKTQLWLAREIGISEPQLSKIVKGWIDPPEELKMKIAGALCCGVQEVFSCLEDGKGASD
jgi:DNA-binding XRE family transcriptional regulator